MRRNYIAIQREALPRYEGKSLAEVAELFISADTRKKHPGVYVGRKIPKGDWPLIVSFCTVEDLKRFVITPAGIQSRRQDHGR